MNTNRRPPIRKILVLLDPSEYAQSATDYACRAARAHDATVSGLSVLDSPEIRSFVIPSEYDFLELAHEEIRIHLDRARREIAAVEKRFSEECRANRVITHEMVEEGIPVDLILEAATLFDLVIVGLRTFFHFETRGGDGELLTRILGRTSTPILAVPSPPRPLQRALLAYDGSVASARAMRDFVLFAMPFDLEVDLFLADEDRKRLDFHADKLRHYLRDHEIPVSKVIRSPDPPLAAIEDGVTKDYDLVVCGMHSKKPVHDFFVGSFAKRLIVKEENALLLSH